MFWQLESIGIEPTEEIGNALVGIGIQEGKVFPAYTKGYTYINHWFKNLQLSIHIKKPHDGQNAEVVGTSMQISGDKSYRLRVIHTLNSLDPDDPLERRILANCADEDKSLFVLDVVNADILPCWKEDTVITLQMIAKALSLHVYADEQAFVDATAVPVQNEHLNDGEETKLTAAVGSFLPMGCLSILIIVCFVCRCMLTIIFIQMLHKNSLYSSCFCLSKLQTI
ncbi:MAG: hypothetical protein IJK28_09550 [Clostridia bacterium]|nr:hypothetical protein [Clostridia bacterium]